MATIKAVILSGSRKNDGTFNIKIRITHNRISRYIKTPFFVGKEQLTRNGKIKDSFILDKVNERIMYYRKRLDSIGFSIERMDIDTLMSAINEDSSSCSDFFDYSKIYCSRKHSNGCGTTAQIYEDACNRLMTFVGKRVLPFSEMTSSLMYSFVEWLVNNYRISTVQTTIGNLKSIYNDAKKHLNIEGSGMDVVVWDCFSNIEIPKKNEMNQRAFSELSEMQALIDCPYIGIPRFDLAKDMFIFSFVCYGMNISDIRNLKTEDLKDGVITYKRSKVERRMGDRCVMKVKLNDVSNAILDKYKGNDTYLIDYKGVSRANPFTKEIQYVFKSCGLKEGYVFYTARHSMASFARNECGIDMFLVNEMLDHAVPNSMRMADVYIKRDYSPIWEANEKLMSKFRWDNYIDMLKHTHLHL